ncbi:MAG: hypothetical protein EPN91_07560 [Salinibacterium sp.]|nr:MAG: hypothetical protein EPN91_07560 [Salinibacterium sp.]
MPLDDQVFRLYEFRVRRRLRKNAVTPYRHVDGVISPIHLAAIFRKTLDGDARENFFAFHFDIRTRLIGIELVAIGNDFGVTVHPSNVFRGALLSGAAGIAVAHNHPSGDATPSPEDDELTECLRAGGKLLGIPVMDHVIVTDAAYYSYLEQQRFPWDAKTIPTSAPTTTSP